MRRRRREISPIPSPLIGQGFPPHQAAKAVIQVVREIHEINYDLDPREIEETLLEAVRKARRERGQGGGA
jgi:hypothetical protein